MSQLPNHEANHRHIHESFARLRHPLVVFGEAALAVQPGERPLHYPPTRQGHKTLLPLHLLYYRKLPAKCAFHPLYELPSVAAVSPYQAQATVTPPVRVARLLDTLIQCSQHHLTSISVLHRGGGNCHRHHQPHRIHNQMSLASCYILACIIASLLATFYSLDALAVEYDSAWLLVPALLLPQLFSQSSVELFPLAVYAPQPEVVVDALPGWEVMGQRPPEATVLDHVEDGVEHLSPTVKARATGALLFGQQWRD